MRRSVPPLAVLLAFGGYGMLGLLLAAGCSAPNQAYVEGVDKLWGRLSIEYREHIDVCPGVAADYLRYVLADTQLSEEAKAAKQKAAEPLLLDDEAKKIKLGLAASLDALVAEAKLSLESRKRGRKGAKALHARRHLSRRSDHASRVSPGGGGPFLAKRVGSRGAAALLAS